MRSCDQQEDRAWAHTLSLRFIQIGVDMRAVTAKGDTGLHQAVRSIEYSNWMIRLPEAIERLLAVGVNPCLRNKEDKTARELVERFIVVFSEDQHRICVLHKAED